MSTRIDQKSIPRRPLSVAAIRRYTPPIKAVMRAIASLSIQSHFNASKVCSRSSLERSLISNSSIKLWQRSQSNSERTVKPCLPLNLSTRIRAKYKDSQQIRPVRAPNKHSAPIVLHKIIEFSRATMAKTGFGADTNYSC